MNKFLMHAIVKDLPFDQKKTIFKRGNVGHGDIGPAAKYVCWENKKDKKYQNDLKYPLVSIERRIMILN